MPVALILAYGAARVLSQGFNELRNAVFAKVGQRAVRRLALSTFRHIHALSLRFHLERRTGGLARAVERGTAGIEFLLSFMLFNVVPTLFEIAVVCAILWRLYDWTFALVTLATIVVYIAFTFCRDRLAHPASARDEHAQHRGQHEGGRQPAQLRDRQIFRERGARGGTLRPRAAGL